MNTSPQQTSTLHLMAIGVPIALLALLTAVLSNLAPPRENLVVFFSLFAFSTISLAVIGWKNLPAFQSSRLSTRHWLIFVLATAAILRLGVLAAPVSLSDDVYRYVWDGTLMSWGYSPYGFTPHRIYEIFDGMPLYTQGYEKLNSPYYYTVYPPLAQIIFAPVAIIAMLTEIPGERLMRCVFLGADLLTIGLLIVVLKKLIRRRTLVLLYAWNPFIFWELIGGGHTEALLLPVVLWIIYAIIKDQPAYKIGFLLGLAALLKTTALVISPVLAFYLLRRRNIFAPMITAFVSAGVIAAAYTWLWHYELIPGHQESFALYAEKLSFNAPIFYILQHLAGYREGLTPPVQHLITPWLSLVTIVLIAIAAFYQNGRNINRLLIGFTAAFSAHLFFSAVFHPWYLTPVLLCALLTTRQIYTPLLLFSLLVPISYVFYMPDISQNTKILVMAAQFIPPICLILLSPAKHTFDRAISGILKTRARHKFSVIHPHLNAGDSILDIGAGEGFVGLHATEHGHHTHLVDVSDRNLTTLPFTTYDGQILPFDDNQFDVGILAYVLHHCHDPDRVLREAARVCKRLIILETVYITENDRRRTTFLDHNANRLRGMPKEPLRFDTPQGWTERFDKLDLTIQHFEWLGQGIHKHVIFVLDRR